MFSNSHQLYCCHLMIFNMIIDTFIQSIIIYVEYMNICKKIISISQQNEKSLTICRWQNMKEIRFILELIMPVIPKVGHFFSYFF